MDPVSAIGLVSSIAGLVDLAVKAIGECKRLIETAQNAPRDLRTVLVEVSSLNSAVENLSFLAKVDAEFADSVSSEGIADAVAGCSRTLEDLINELGCLAVSPAAPGRRERAKAAVLWTWKEDSVKKLLANLQQYKTTITLGLVGQTSRDIREIRTSVKKIEDKLGDAERHLACDWLEQTNPTQIHATATQLHEDHTAQWVLRMDEWKAWLDPSSADEPRRFLWIHGIPGAGKTVLAAFLIDQVGDFCLQKRRGIVAHVYYYCSYRNNVGDDEATPMLRWIVGQLCREMSMFPSLLLHCYHTKTTPDLPKLKESLEILLEYIDTLYLIVDAVDESSPREELLQFLEDVVTNPSFANVQLLATSRRYADIESVLSRISTPISMSNPEVDKDIRTYVSSALSKRFPNWSQSLRDDVREALVNGAKGMFRWAVCQMDILKRRRTEMDVRKALKELPETLDETYERIFLEIPKDDQKLARTALVWICGDALVSSSDDHIPSNTVLHAMFCEDWEASEPLQLDPAMGLSTAIIQEICGCLITYSEVTYGDAPFERVTLAHYTVLEFLQSDRILNSRAAYFSITREVILNEYFVKAQLRATHVDREHSDLATQPWESFEFDCLMIALESDELDDEVVARDDLWEGEVQILEPRYIMRLLDSELRPGTTWAHFHPDWSDDDDSSDFVMRQAKVLTTLFVLERQEFASKFLEGKDFSLILSVEMKFKSDSRARQHKPLGRTSDDAGHLVGTVLEVLAMNYLIDSYRTKITFLERFSSSLNPRQLLVSLVAVHFHQPSCPDNECVLQRLWPSSVATNSGSAAFAMTPLQIAAHNWDVDGVWILLELGADPNEVGVPGGLTPYGRGGLASSPWVQSSPLRILRHADFGLGGWNLVSDKPELLKVRRRDRALIQQVLLNHGGRDFYKTEDGKCLGPDDFEFPDEKPEPDSSTGQT